MRCSAAVTLVEYAGLRLWDDERIYRGKSRSDDRGRGVLAAERSFPPIQRNSTNDSLCSLRWCSTHHFTRPTVSLTFSSWTVDVSVWLIYPVLLILACIPPCVPPSDACCAITLLLSSKTCPPSADPCIDHCDLALAIASVVDWGCSGGG